MVDKANGELRYEGQIAKSRGASPRAWVSNTLRYASEAFLRGLRVDSNISSESRLDLKRSEISLWNEVND